MPASTVVAITGSSAGLGRAIAHAYAKRGAKLAASLVTPRPSMPRSRSVKLLEGKLFVL